MRSIHGFKICGDNIDKTVHCRHMRIDKQVESLHYFHSYAIKDRIKISDVSVISPSNTPTAEVVISTVQPDDEDDALIHVEFAVLVSRILCKHMPFFKSNYADVCCTKTRPTILIITYNALLIVSQIKMRYLLTISCASSTMKATFDLYSSISRSSLHLRPDSRDSGLNITS